MIPENIPLVGHEHLHLHTHYSILDGYGLSKEYCERAKKQGNKYLCITDHGMMAAIPNQIKDCENNGIEPLYGVELYINPIQPELGEGEKSSKYFKNLTNDKDKERFRKSNHLIGIAYNNKGYENLVKLSSWAWLKGFYYKPRINRDILKQHKDGIIFSSACYNGEIGYAFDQGISGEDGSYEKGVELGREVIKEYLDMFGENFYLELMMLDFSKQKLYDKFLIESAKDFDIPLILTQDAHYCNPEDSYMQRLMLMINTGRTISDMEKAIEKGETDEYFELQDENLWYKSETELNDFWAEKYSEVIPYKVFEQAKINTVKICEKAKGVELDRSNKLPQIENQDKLLFEEVIKGFKERGFPNKKIYADRIKEEYNLICKKGFSSYFLIQKMMTDEARRWFSELVDDEFAGFAAVGKSRGSAGGSFLCYCLGITDIDPIKHDLLFSRFLSPTRGGRSMKLRFDNKPLT